MKKSTAKKKKTSHSKGVKAASISLSKKKVVKKKVTKKASIAKKQVPSRPIAVFSNSESIFLLAHTQIGQKPKLELKKSDNGVKFTVVKKKVSLHGPTGKEENFEHIKDTRVIFDQEQYILTYLYNDGKKTELRIASSKDALNWKFIGRTDEVYESAALAPEYFFRNNYVVFWGDSCVSPAFSPDLKKWHVPVSTELASTRNNCFDHTRINVLGIERTPEGVLVFYDSTYHEHGTTHLLVGAIMFDALDPNIVLWRTLSPLADKKLPKGILRGQAIGSVSYKDKIFVYWLLPAGTLISAIIYHPFGKKSEKMKAGLLLQRFHANPIITPKREHAWEASATFNPAALLLDDKIHLLYRAHGDDGMSVIGYASSKDGYKIDERLKLPIYVPRARFEGVGVPNHKQTFTYRSGMGVDGCEDPQVTRIGDTIYMAYVAFNGYEQTRAALTSISVEDFRNHKWNWTNPIPMSAPPTYWGTGNKNISILPEKVNGKYVIFHRIWPNILIDYVDDLEFGEEKKWLRGGNPIVVPKSLYRDGRSDIHAVPIHEKEGWILFYGLPRGGMGMMILDHHEHTKIIKDFGDVNSKDAKHYCENHGIITPRPGFWDSAKVAVGGTPIKTDKGWLIIYKSVSKQDSSQYKVGAMLTDLNNPAKVIARSPFPVLSPIAWYENHGHKRGIVFPCGTVVKDGKLFVYYGGADTVVCVAEADLHTLVNSLLNEKSFKLISRQTKVES